MLLEVRGMSTASQTFVQLWGVYVSGFKPEKHCIYCLKGKKELQLHHEMQDGDYVLKTDSPYFYLFAMGRVPNTRRMFISRCDPKRVRSPVSVLFMA